MSCLYNKRPYYAPNFSKSVRSLGILGKLHANGRNHKKLVYKSLDGQTPHLPALTTNFSTNIHILFKYSSNQKSQNGTQCERLPKGKQNSAHSEGNTSSLAI